MLLHHPLPMSSAFVRPHHIQRTASICLHFPPPIFHDVDSGALQGVGHVGVGVHRRSLHLLKQRQIPRRINRVNHLQLFLHAPFTEPRELQGLQRWLNLGLLRLHIFLLLLLFRINLQNRINPYQIHDAGIIHFRRILVKAADPVISVHAAWV